MIFREGRASLDRWPAWSRILLSGLASLVALSLSAWSLATPSAQADPGCPAGLSPPPGAYCSDTKQASPYRWEICRRVFNWGSNCTGYREAAPGQWVAFPN